MILNYALDENHYLAHQLYIASKSERIIKKRFKNRIIVPIIYVLFGILLYTIENITLAIVFVLFAVLWYFVYPIWERKRYVNHYKAFIKENFGSKLNHVATVELGCDFIHTVDNGSESKVSTNEVLEFIEISSVFFVKIDGGQCLIIPKENSSDVEAIKLRLKELGNILNVPYSEELNWKWN